MQKRQKCRKICALVMAVLMVMSMMPTTMFDFGVQIVQAAENDELKWDLSTATLGDATADFTVNGFTVKATSSKAVTISKVAADSAVSSVEGVEYDRFLGLGGTGSATYRCITFTLPAKAEVCVYARSGGTAARTLLVKDSAGAEVGTLSAVENTVSVLAAQKIELAAGTYSIWSKSSGINVFDIVVKYNVKLDLSGDVLGSYTSNKTIGEFTLITDGSNAYEIKELTGDSVVTGTDGTEFTRVLDLKGSGNKGKRAISFSLPAKMSIDIYALSGSDTADRTLKLEDASGKKTDVAAPKKASTVKPTTVELEAGTYWLYSGGSGISVFGICTTPDKKEVTPWEEVAAPVINSVTTDDNGDFVVDFTAQIDTYAGAESVKISMLESGHEVKTETVISAKTTSVTFHPLWSGNYTFVAVAQREGEADKASEVVAYDNYVLAVQKPVITWAQNKGGGKVYLDWVNLEDADSYAVGYRTAGSSEEYTYVETALPASQGNYTLSGLTAGTAYEFVVKATRNADGFVSTATKEITVTENEDQNWYVAIVGSAQTTNVTVTAADTTEANYKHDVQDTAANRTNLVQAVSIANTSGNVLMPGTTSGKISDDEDGFTYYFTKIDPNTENFKIGATFTITDVSLTPDNQTGFGLVAADVLGINNWGAPSYVHKYFNYVGSMMYSTRQSSPTLHTVTGYISNDASNNDGAERVVANKGFAGLKSDWTAGASYTFTLEKTNEGYTATCNGQELTLDDNSMTSVQEDGTVCVGLMVSRKVSVNVTDVTFEKSASTGITADSGKNEKITPNGTVYSSGTCGAAEYEYIFVPNCAGVLTVTSDNGFEAKDLALKANEVARVNVPIEIGTNKITASFVPAEAANLTSTATVTKETVVTCARYGKEGETIIVSPEGTADGKGTQESPLDLATALKYAQPGQVIFLKNGVYKKGAAIGRSVSGTEDKNITLVAESISTDGTDGVVFEGAGLSLVGSYWHVYGIYVKNPSGVGIQISGNYNTVEMCTVNHATNSGIQLSRNGSADNEAGRVGKLWPTGNLVKNCESFDNCDASRNDADGFAAKLTCGDGNKFYGCISHNNIDDGWDLYAKSVSGEIGAVEIENCVAYNNGWLTTDDISSSDYKYGEGNGFKLGGGYLKGGHVLRNSVAFGNHAKGITSNSCPDCKIFNCTSYNNSLNGSALKSTAYNVGLNTKDSNVKAWEVSGLISLNNPNNTTLADLIPFSLNSENNYIYNGSVSYNNSGVQAVEDWFESVDISVLPTRNADGTINMNGLLSLKDNAPADSGARLDVTSDAAKSVAPQITDVVEGPVEPENQEEQFDSEYTGLTQNKNGDFVFVTGGKVDEDKYAYVEYDGAKFLVANGMVAADANGLAQDPGAVDDWYFVAKGQVQAQVSGIVGYEDEWFYVENGKLDTTYSGYADYDGGKFLVAAGRIVMEAKGLVQDPNNAADWYYVADGQVVNSYVGLVLYDGSWFYVVNGKLDTSFTGEVEYDGAIFTVVNGMMVTDDLLS